jgi:ketosteroid isomerase-like protein
MARKKQMNGTAAETEAAFYDALSRADVDALMALWAEDEEIICIHPGAPRLIGHAAIRASWEAILEHGGLHIRTVQLHETHNLMSSVHNVIEQVEIPKGEAPDVHILATNVYVKSPQGWRIVVHHASFAAGRVAAEPAADTVAAGHMATLH